MRRFLSFAKINLYLAVLGRRPDGYHEIDTLMQTVDLADRLELEPLAAERIEVVCPAGGAPEGEDNLVWQALTRLKQRCGVRGGMRVALRKRIPARAGLGGGSSNVACALSAGSQLWGLELSDQELEAFGAQIGSDVPFFVRGGTQRCRGRGEILEPQPPLPDSTWVIVAPPWGLETGHVYAKLRSGLTYSPPRVRILLESLAKRDLPTLVAEGFNDLEGPASEIEPAAARLSACMREANLLGVRLTGSGSAWIGMAPNPEDARAVEQAAGGQGWVVHRVRPTTRGWIEETG
jgi:4-diphosphocytidyl-2-C-methyl-D-erythritol kinase